MAIMLKTAARFLLLCFLSFGSTLGNTVSVSLSSETGYVGGQLELTCLLNPTAGAIVTSVKWFRGSDTNGIRRNAATCNLVGSAPSYDLNRYSFSCSSNIFKLRISSLESSDGGQCWTCSVTFSNFLETDKASESCIKVQATTSTPTNTLPPTTGKEPDTLPVALIIGVCVGGFIFILSIIIIICCCCCRCCCLYHSCRKKENKQNYGADFNEIVTNFNQSELEMEPHIQETPVKMHQINQLHLISDVIKTSTSQEQNIKN